ncbi:MAG: glutathione S-transferase family protein [Lentisphaeraceae bacterium]|nr:glutathione S-transferase family protein [Lentisphaeraceae bacterium]
MKLYNHSLAPNPRRVRIFLAEKGKLDQVELIDVDILKGEQNKPCFRERNPFGGVPVLEIDDTTYISESVSISRYFENIYPENSLLGKSALESATIDMWQRRAEVGVLTPIGTYFHQATEGLGEKDKYRNKEWGQYNLVFLKNSLTIIEHQLQKQAYLAGSDYSIADITLLCALDFGLYVGIIDFEEIPAVKSWYELVSKRVSSGA